MAGELGFDTGPYVSVAVFCEKHLQEQDGALSLIRLVNQISVQAEGPEVPEELPPGIVETLLIVVLRAGQAQGPQRITVTLEYPDGSQHEGGADTSVNFPSGSPHAGVNIVMPVKFPVESAGLYWADVKVNGRLVTRVPLAIEYGFTRRPAQ